MKALFDALNIAYDAKEQRVHYSQCDIAGIHRGRRRVPFAGDVGRCRVACGPRPSRMQTAIQWIVTIIRWPLLLLGIVIGLAFIYELALVRERPMALDHGWQRRHVDYLDCIFNGFFVLRCKLRQLP